jgi:hypothetical protein
VDSQWHFHLFKPHLLNKGLFKNHSGFQSTIYLGLCRFLFGANSGFASFLMALQTNSLE